MTLSDLEPSANKAPAADKEPSADSSVSWRLNELISAGRKAKAFAAQWSQPEVADNNPEFELWKPKVLDGQADEEAESITEEASDEEDVSELDSAPELDAEIVATEEQPIVESFDQSALDQARSEGFEQGYQQAIDEAEGKWASARDEFIHFTETLRKAQGQDNNFFQPLKKLALHLAEQLVRGELTQSTTVIERLIDAAIKDIEQQGEGPIVINLSAADHQQFTAHLSTDLDNLSLRIDPTLSQGSVRINMDDSAVEDLIEARLAALSEELLGLTEHQSAPRNSAKRFQDLRSNSVAEGASVIEGSIIEDNNAAMNPSAEAVDDETPDA